MDRINLNPLAHDLPGRRRSVAAAVAGNFAEFYDWTVYAFMAPIFASQIFHAEDPRISLLLAFSAFAIGYIARPAGSVLFGTYSDRFGRRNVMAIAIIAMSACSLIIALTPNYEQIGILSPLLVLTARLIQGISAGGEAGSATTYLMEFSKPGRRAFFTSFHQISTGFSTLCALSTSLILTATLNAEDLSSWGWRIPFFIGAVLGILGLYLRLRAEETPVFQASKIEPQSPVLPELAKAWRKVLLTTAITLLPNVAFFSWQIYLPTYIKTTTNLGHSTALNISMIGIVVFLLLIPLSAMLSDRFGRKPMMISYSLAMLIWAYPTYVGIPANPDSFVYALFIAIVGNIILATMAGSLVACMTEQFSTGVRATGAGLSYAMGVVISGASYPTIVTALMGAGNYLSIVGYIVIMSVIGLVAHIVMPETRDHEVLPVKYSGKEN